MAAENLSLLGAHVPRSLSSYATALSLARDSFGKSLPENAVDLGSNMAKAFAPGGNAGRDAALALGVSLRSWERDMMGDLGGTAKQAPGMLARGAALIGKATLTDRFVSSAKSSMAQFTAARLGALADTPFESLSAQAKDELARYSLHGPNWEVTRQAVAKDGDLKGMITPEAIGGFPTPRPPRSCARASPPGTRWRRARSWR